MHTPQSQGNQSRQGGVVLTPSANSGGTIEMPSLDDFLSGILLDDLKRSPDFLASTLKSFAIEDVCSVELLVTLISNVKIGC